MDRVVISVGGSVLADTATRPSYLRDLSRCLTACTRTARLFVTTGGGPIARSHITAGRSLGISERALDLVGIQATRLNAQLLAAAMRGRSNTEIPTTVEDAVRMGSRHRLVIMGGTEPGWTTDAVAARLAVAVKASHLVNATAVDGVYDKDPKRISTAKRYDRLTYPQLVRLVGRGHRRAGPNIVFDPIAARLVARHRIPVFVVDGRHLANLGRAILGEPFDGTRVG